MSVLRKSYRDSLLERLQDPAEAAAYLEDGEAADPSIPFIPMPGHLRTREEMVRWLTDDLPKLTAAIAQPGSDGRR